ncbi:MAG: IMP dehydrogenase [Candidatus Dormibacteria bacterium]
MARIEPEIRLDFRDVLLVPQPSPKVFGDVSRNGVSLVSRYGIARGTCPIIAANMDHVGTFKMAQALASFHTYTCLVKHYTIPDLIEFYLDNPAIGKYAIYSMGCNDTDFAKFSSFQRILEHKNVIAGPKIVCIDVANAYIPNILAFLEKFKITYPQYHIMAGNVVTPERTLELLTYGADIVKVGIGPGSACATRRETGVGYPQLSAVLECASAAAEVNGSICSDGGIECPGDVVKAFAAGANWVMIGGQFAGHVEGYKDAELLEATKYGNGNKLPFYGMASQSAQVKHNGGLAEYRASEGKEFMVPMRGKIATTMQHYLGGIRSACTYLSCLGIDDLREDATFIKVNQQLNHSQDIYEVR